MLEMETMDQEDFLSLKLSIAPDRNREGKRKRTRTTEISNYSSLTHEFPKEDEIFALLQTRETMLKMDHNKRSNGGEGLHLIHSLLIAAASMNKNHSTSALENLSQLYRFISLRGDSIQRVAAYFADALLAHLLTQKSPFYDAIMKAPSPEEEFSAFTSLYKVSPFYQFAHFTANQAITEAFEREGSRALHVLDFDISYGFQWPSLMQSLSENATPTNKISLKLTAFGGNMEEIQETESRLISFAKGFSNLVFEFHGLVRGSTNVKVKKRKDETIAINLVFHLTSLKTLSKISETLTYVYSIKPSIVVLVEQEGKGSSNKFLPRFVESLHHFAAIFDSLDDCLPLESDERLSIERDHLGREISSVINYDRDDDESCPRFEKMETWNGRMERRGFVGVEQSSRAVMQAKLLLKIRSHCCPIEFDGENGGFRVFERENGKAISLGWQDRILITASSWCSGV